jgi:OmpA-OmpF porin, OOP family
MFKQGMVIGAVLAGALSLVATNALAADDDHDSGFYLGAALGDFSANYQKPGDATSQHLTFNRNDATRIMAGWRFLPYLAVQLDWSDYGRSQAAVNELGLTTKTDAWTPSVIGTLPIGPVELFAKVGESFYNVHLNDNTGRLVNSSGNDPVYGVGVGVTIIKRLNLSAEYERIKLNSFDKPDAVWLNASWRFGTFR